MKATDPVLSVVVPTRNEQENITVMLDALRAALAGVASEILVVDDSDDDTPDIARRAEVASTTLFRVRLFHREQGPARAGGLATAVDLGMRQARAKYVAVIDADMQHPPERLRALLDAALANDADVVMATRYRKGGKANGLDGISRRAISIGLKYVAKVVFPDQLLSVSDPLGGFFLVRRSIIEGVKLRPIGYKISLELLIRCRWSRLVEVPYQFNARAGGQSKSNFKQGLMVFQHMLRLVREVPAAARFWKYVAVGATGVLVNIALFTLLLTAKLPYWPAWLGATEISILSNYALNSFMTWRDMASPRKRDWLSRAVRYHFAVVPNIVLSLLVFGLLARAHSDQLLIDQALGIGAGILLSYWIARRVVFIPREVWSGPFPARIEGAIPIDEMDTVEIPVAMEIERPTSATVS